MRIIQTIKPSIIVGFLLSTFAFIVIAVYPLSAAAAVQCSFTQDLEIGIDGEEVRCLQQYLNGAGFVIADSGVGSPGNETSLFRTLTKEAVAKWQTVNGLNATGYFGPLSRAKYNELTSGAVVPTIPTTTTSSTEDVLKKQLADLLNQVEILRGKAATVGMATEESARKLLSSALSAVEDAEEQIEETQDDGGSIGSADEDIADAKDDLFAAILAYFNKKYDQVMEHADDAYDNAVDAFQDAGGETDEDEAEDLIDVVQEEIDEAWETIDRADRDGDDVDDAEDLLREAEDVLEQSEEALDDEEFDDARDLAEEAQDLVDEAIDAISSSEEADAEDAIDDAQDAIDDAQDQVSEAEDDGEDVDDAQDLLDEAEDLLEEAKEAFDDEDYDDAKDLAKEAEDRADEALDEI